MYINQPSSSLQIFDENIIERRMAFRGNTGGALKMWRFFGLILLCFNFPSPSTQDTLETLLNEVRTSAVDLKCYVCSSVDGECETVSDDMSMECKLTSGPKSYLEAVYGSMALTDTGKDLKMWPPSLTELATGAGAGASTSPTTTPAPTTTQAPAPTGATGPTPTGVTGATTGNGSESGWVYATFPGAYLEKKPTAASEKLTVSGISLGRADGMFKGGFKSCRVMKIWTDSQKNDGKTQEIPETKPRIVRTCSLVPTDKGGENFKDGCRVINFKTATISVCYCADKDKPCNTSSRLQVSSIAVFLAISMLSLFINF